jgi:hypothetical protein
MMHSYGVLEINTAWLHRLAKLSPAALVNGIDPIMIGLFGVILILLLTTILVIIVLTRRRRQVEPPPSEEIVDVAQRLADSIVSREEEERAQAAFKAASAQPPSSSPRSKILAELGARHLLDQVNSHLLTGRGKITTRSGEIRIEWTDLNDSSVQRLIMIRVQDSSTLLINGQPFPATRDGAQRGLISCLKGMNLE